MVVWPENAIDVDDYVKGVVPLESPAAWPNASGARRRFGMIAWRAP